MDWKICVKFNLYDKSLISYNMHTIYYSGHKKSLSFNLFLAYFNLQNLDLFARWHFNI